MCPTITVMKLLQGHRLSEERAHEWLIRATHRPEPLRLPLRLLATLARRLVHISPSSQPPFKCCLLHLRNRQSSRSCPWFARNSARPHATPQVGASDLSRPRHLPIGKRPTRTLLPQPTDPARFMATMMAMTTVAIYTRKSTHKATIKLYTFLRLDVHSQHLQ